MAFNTHQHKYSWNVFFIFKRFSPFSHPPQPPASRRKRLKAAPEKAPFQPSVLSAGNLPERRLISGCPVESGNRDIDRLITQSEILQLSFLANSPDMNHSRRTYHATQRLEISALHHLMRTEILLQQHINLYFRKFGRMKILLQLLYLN